MRGVRRLAILGTLAAGAASCEALVGIGDRELAPADASSGDGNGGRANEEAAGGDASSDGEPLTASDSTTGGDATARDADHDHQAASLVDGADESSDTSTPTDSGEVGDAPSAADGATDVAAEGPSEASGPEAGDGGDGGAPLDPDVPCAQQPLNLYCNDFDSVNPLSTWSWTYNSNPDGGSILQLDTTAYVSPPRSVQVVAPPVTSQIQLARDVGTLYTSFRLAFDLRVDMSTLANIPQIGVAQVLVARTTGTLQVNYVIGPGAAAALQVFGATDGGPALNVGVATPTPMTWARIAIAYDSTAGISVYRNGQLEGTLSVGPGAPGDTTIIMGDAFVNASGTQTVTTEEDNIVITGH